MKKLPFFSVLLSLLMFISCTADPQNVSECVIGQQAGFFLGLWHGFISPFSFIISLFEDSITVFEVNNNGTKYIFGFLLGVGAFTSGSVFGTRKSRKS